MASGTKGLSAGFLAGVVATVPMTLTMIVIHELTTGRESRPLPPYEITMHVSDKAGLMERLRGEEERSGLTTLAHFSYGGIRRKRVQPSDGIHAAASHRVRYCVWSWFLGGQLCRSAACAAALPGH